MPTVIPIIDSGSCKIFFKKCGTMGMTIPKPSKSIKIVKNVTRNAEVLFVIFSYFYTSNIGIGQNEITNIINANHPRKVLTLPKGVSKSLQTGGC